MISLLGSRGGRVLLLSLCLVASLAASASAQSAPASAPAGEVALRADANGALLLHGRPVRAIGVNCFNLFYRAILKKDDGSWKAALATMAKHKVPFARFAACGFWPKDWELYRTDKAEYFRRLDAVVEEANRLGVGLIPSLFWYHGAVPDLVGETMDQWGNPQSKTLAFVRAYTVEVVTRYRNSPAIWGWEFGNEYNLPADLPNREKFRPAVNVAGGTATTRSTRDDLSGAMIVTATREFARAVRKIDARRPIFSGHSSPRPYGWHNWRENSWTLDTPAQFIEMLLRDNPAPVDTLTIHVYPDKKKSPQEAMDDVEKIVRNSMTAAAKAGKPLFVGEFGVGHDEGKDAERSMFERYLKIIEESRAPLSAVWVLDLKQQDGTYNITPDNDRAYMLELIEKANARLAGQ